MDFEPGPFDVFDNISKKEKKKFESEAPLEYFVEHDTGKYRFIPSLAFEDIHGFEEYSHLKDGLFVAEKKLKDCSRFRDSIGTLKFKTKESDIWFWRWTSAKKVSERMNARFMTPAEYFCVYSYLKLVEEDELIVDMVKKENECLDGMIIPTKKLKRGKRNYKFRTLGKMINQAYMGGESYNIGPNSYIARFDDDDVDPRLGIPTTYCSKGENSMSLTKTMKPKVLVRDLGWKTYPKSIVRIRGQHPKDSSQQLRMRLCYNSDHPEFKDLKRQEKKRVMSW